jgi:hypothetical protein
VATPSWSTPVSDAYPLSELAYSAVSICYATDDERSIYHDLISWMVSPDGGQIQGDALGQLPRGYYPITAAQHSLAETALADIANPQNKAARCAKPKKSLWNMGSGTLSLPGSSLSDSSEADSSGGPKLFIRAPYYGQSADNTGGPALLPLLTAGGYIAGIPLAIAGLLMQLSYRRSPSGRRRAF